MPITCKPLAIEGLYSIQPQIFSDERGYFLETYNERELAAVGIKECFVQDNQSWSRRGVLRGLHYQKAHPQAKLVRVIAGEVFDVVVDLRSGSVTFGCYDAQVLSSEFQNQVFIPAGLAHGFLVLSEQAFFAYKCTDFFHPEDENGLRWDDPGLAIEWPDLGMAPLMSSKDLALPYFDPAGKYFI